MIQWKYPYWEKEERFIKDMREIPEGFLIRSTQLCYSRPKSSGGYLPDGYSHFIDRRNGIVSFDEWIAMVLPGYDVRKFELEKGEEEGWIRIYLLGNRNNKFHLGKTCNIEEAEEWVGKVNRFYEGLRSRKI